MIPLRELTRITGAPAEAGDGHDTMRIFTMRIGQVAVGVPVARVHTVFRIERLTRVPLAAAALMGLLNLRGEITPAISLHQRLGQPLPACVEGMLAVGLEASGERFALVCDEVGDVAELMQSDSVALPFASEADGELAGLTYFQRESGLVAVIDPDVIFAPSNAKRKKAA